MKIIFIIFKRINYGGKFPEKIVDNIDSGFDIVITTGLIYFILLFQMIGKHLLCR